MLYQVYFCLCKYLTSSQPAVFFAILLIGPTTLFTNALPADGDISETIQVEYAAFLEKDYPLTADATAYNGDLLVMPLAGVGSSGGRVDNYTTKTR